MHVVIILLILFILLYCFAIFPEMSRQKRMKAFHGIMFAHRGLHGFTVRLTEFRKIPCQLFALQFKKITELSWIFI